MPLYPSREVVLRPWETLAGVVGVLTHGIHPSVVGTAGELTALAECHQMPRRPHLNEVWQPVTHISAHPSHEEVHIDQARFWR